MFKKFTLALAVAGIILVGTKAAPVSALSADEIQTQITALLAQIRELSNQLTTLRQQQVQPTTPIPPDTSSTRHRVCLYLSRTIGVGSSGEDVQGMQEYLRDQGYYNGDTTGYFGPLTANAVAQWQSTQGLSSVGIVGPASRERVKRWCDGWGGGNGALTASPQSGSAPLSVSFYTKISGFHPGAISYVINYGDGSSEPAASCNAPADACVSPGVNTHTYQSNGTYTATLVKKTMNDCKAPPGAACADWNLSEQILGTVKIDVGGQLGCSASMDYRPVCAAKSVVCFAAPCNPIPTTYSNKCKMAADNASFLYEGECRSGTTNPENDPLCKSWFDGCNTCSRQSAGGPAMCTLMACVRTGDAQLAPYCKAYFDGSSGNKPPVISGVSGPTTLTVNQSGTWSVNASDPENGTLSYDITWGDEYSPYALMNSAASAPSFVQTSTFTHSYSRAGTFTITVVVRDNAGQSAKTTTTVQVGGNGNYCWTGGVSYPEGTSKTCITTDGGQTSCIADAAYVCRSGEWKIEGGLQACTMEYAPVCGQPKSYCPSGMMCTQQMPLPKTYGNKCSLYADGATYLYAGECGAPTPASGSLQVSGSGQTVTITGPENLNQKINSCVYSVGWFGAGGNGTTVDWGDGSVSPVWNGGIQGQSCVNAQKTHTYSYPGTYTIQAKITHPGPTDGPITDWTGSANFTAYGSGGLTMCTADAMMCPDGTSVGRSGPNCQFVCPTGGSAAANQCANGYKWCAAGVSGYSCAYAPTGVCPNVL